MAETAHSLSGVPLLRSLDDAARHALEQRCRWHRYGAHEEIIDRESDSRDVYFIISGRVRVVVHSLPGREIAFHEMDAGDYFGQLAAIDGQPRSASVVALNDSLLASVSPDTFVSGDRRAAALGQRGSAQRFAFGLRIARHVREFAA